MDHYECFISDADIKNPSLSSPGPSSGYCSADESHQSRYDSTPAGTSAAAAGAKFRETDSPWRGQTSPFMNFSSDPCMGTPDANLLGGVRSTGVMSSSVDSFSDIKSSLSFDDLMDTWWDPFADMSRVSDFASNETIADIEMSESPSLSGFLRGSIQNGYGATQSGSESSLLSLLRSQDRGTPVGGALAQNAQQNSVVYSNFGMQQSQSGFNQSSQFGRGGSGATNERNYFNANQYAPVQQVRTGSSVSSEPRKASIVTSKDSGFCQTVSSLHQHMASLTDMGFGDCCDDSDYILQLAQQSNHNVSSVSTHSGSPSVPIAMPVNRVQLQNSTILGGVFSQRSPVTSLRPCEPKAFTRIKGGVVATSCGTLLRHSVTAPTTLGQSAMGRSYSEFSMKNGFISPPSSFVMKNGERSASSCDMKGGRTMSAYPGLDDHRYTLKPLSNPPAKLSRSRKSATSNHSSNSSLYSMNGTTVKTTSILEAFLRSTRPMDPNKGSNAALAAEGLTYFRHEERKPRDFPEHQPSVVGGTSGMLLKKLLTGEIDQKQVLHNDQDRPVTTSSQVDRMMCPSLHIDSPLIDGFGLDVDLSLDDSQLLGGLNLLDGTDMPDITDSVWLGDLSDELVASELDEILAEQTRRDDLWLEHYTGETKLDGMLDGMLDEIGQQGGFVV